MARRSSPSLLFAREARHARGVPAFLALVLCALVLAFGLAMHSSAAFAQSAPTTNNAAPVTPPPKMMIQADELVNNKDKNTITAEGHARIYYKGRVLQADRVIYDRNTNRVYAEGNATLTERDGTVVHAQRFDLTQDFADGFIESLRSETTAVTYFSAPRAERIGNNITVFEKGTYTACQTCRDNPDKPPLWRVRAKRIIHNQEEHMVYYDSAWLEFVGIPVAYVPLFSSADPTVKRKSGVLMPNLVESSYLGTGFSVPIFWAMAPNYDLTFTPTYFTQQGFFGDVIWRHRLDSGSYYIRANGIFPQDREAFPASPFGASDRTFRGEVESVGNFLIAPQWNFGWAVTAMTDKWYYNDFKIPIQNTTAYYTSDVTSTAYLTGQSDRSYFDLRGFYFEGLTSHDLAAQNTTAAPVLSYNRIFDIDPAKSYGAGGEAQIDFNLSNVSAALATYQAVGAHQYDPAFGLYDICTTYTPGKTTTNCLLRGIGGDYTRVTADASWKRKFIDPIGEVWTPFAFARVNGEFINLNTSNSQTFGAATISNANQTNFIGPANAGYGYAMPGAGLEYRYPMTTKVPGGTFVAEPIGQIIARPNAPLGTTSLLDLDSQSLVFDDSTLFAWDKYSGYDRFETGLRANYGGDATYRFNNGGYVNVVGGQSVQVAGTNSYATPDAANVGLSSGLDTPWSDYVTALTVVPSSILSFTAKGRFDQATLDPRRIDLIANTNLGPWTGGIQFADYQAQPLLGYSVRREGIALSSRYAITPNYFVAGNITFDMSRQYYPAPLVSFNPGPFAISSYGILGGYKDECTTFQLSYTNNYVDNGAGSFNHNQTFMVNLQLRTLGDTAFSHNFVSTANGQTLDAVP
ncbi:MAG: LPS-assembly protein LptD [Methylovirgula sp.]|jgi:LPS-assembly protein